MVARKNRFFVPDISEILKRPADRWIIPECFEENRIGILTGPCDYGVKEHIAFTIAMAVANGEECFAGKAQVQGSVFFAGWPPMGLDWVEGMYPGYRDRHAAWCHGAIDQDHLQDVFITEKIHLDSEGDAFGFEHDVEKTLALGATPPKLIVVSNYFRSTERLKLSSDGKRSALRDYLNKLKERWPGCAFLVIEDRGEDASFELGTDFTLAINWESGPVAKRQCLSISVERQRHAAERKKPWKLLRRSREVARFETV